MTSPIRNIAQEIAQWSNHVAILEISLPGHSEQATSQDFAEPSINSPPISDHESLCLQCWASRNEASSFVDWNSIDSQIRHLLFLSRNLEILFQDTSGRK